MVSFKNVLLFFIQHLVANDLEEPFLQGAIDMFLYLVL